MKKFLTLIAAMVLILALAACGADKKTAPDMSDSNIQNTGNLDAQRADDAQQLTESTTVVSDTKGNLNTQVDQLTNTGMTYTLYNTSQTYIYFFGTPYSLQQLIDGKWYNVPQLPPPKGSSWAWTMQGYFLKAGNRFEQTENWGSMYGSLSAGQYRLIKHLDVFYTEGKFNSSPANPDEKYTVAIPFTIE